MRPAWKRNEKGFLHLRTRNGEQSNVRDGRRKRGIFYDKHGKNNNFPGSAGPPGALLALGASFLGPTAIITIPHYPPLSISNFLSARDVILTLYASYSLLGPTIGPRWLDRSTEARTTLVAIRRSPYRAGCREASLYLSLPSLMCCCFCWREEREPLVLSEW